MNKTSIIVPSYDTIRLQRWITSACIGNISRYTNEDEYELIFVDQQPPGGSGDLNQRFHNIKIIDKWLKPIGNLGCSAAMNLGAKEANLDMAYLCFMHNDVLVWEGWLEGLRSIIEEGIAKIVMPHQGADTREAILKYRSQEWPKGNDDAGLILMTKEMFDKSGGWDERFKTIYMDMMFRRRFPEPYYTTSKCVITHITCGTLWAWTQEEEQTAYNEESKFFNQ